MELLKLLSANELVAQIISFALVFWLLKAFLWKRLLALLDARRERIAQEVADTGRLKQEAAQAKAEYEAKIAVIDEEARRRLQAAQESGLEVMEEMRKKARQEAQEIIENAKENTRYELAKAKEALKDELVELTIKATENIIGETLTEDRDRKLVAEFLERVDKTE